MDNRWSEKETKGLSELDLLVYQSRLIGADPSLVVWGGGNTSIKVPQKDFRGRDTTVIVVKGSGFDLRTIERSHFPSLRLEDILPLFQRESMSDKEMVDYLNRCMMEPGAPRPSIETLLHAFLPAMAVAHSHADAVVALTNNKDAQQVLQTVYGGQVAVIEYIRPGFLLSKKVGEAVRGNPQIAGVVLVNHGLFTWGDTAKAAYDAHIDLVTRAEDYAGAQPAGKKVFGGLAQRPLEAARRREVAAAVAPTLRGMVGKGRRAVLRYDDSPDVLEFVGSQRGKELSGIGLATPDHLIQTKQKPLWVDIADPEDVPSLIQALRQGLDRAAEEYSQWYREHNTGGEPMLEPNPRVVLAPGIGMWTTGRDYRGP